MTDDDDLLALAQAWADAAAAEREARLNALQQDTVGSGVAWRRAHAALEQRATAREAFVHAMKR